MIKALLLLVGGLKFGPLAVTGGTMLLSLVTYAFVFGWGYAAGFVLMLLVHEMGHYIAAKRRGLNVGAPTFIPFVGAWIQLKQQPMNVETEAYVAFAGPFLGTLGAFAAYFWAREVDSRLLLAVAYSGFFLNLINLLPVSPLDGGRITAILSPRVWLLGAPIMLGLLLYRPSPVLLLVALFAAPQVLKAWRHDPNSPEAQAYYNAPLDARIEYGVLYLGLTALLAIMTYSVHGMLEGSRAF
ncbi:site-2 protease family protein [Inquilinus sp. Marseille-Q2685]|uniref:site-2 protease family protein n=1 Tax=Inquilinus sp. Marseille-Q2685 TaxID=2866581 RepID=UPI001CE42402|nr:site-2 protease family protein [Inquilinus sp. Marseille-Q2685]